MVDEHFEDSVAQLENGDVECAAAEIVNRDGAFLGAIEAVGEGSGSRLIDEAQNFKAGHAASVLGGLALRIVEVGGHGDDGLRDGRAEEAFGVALELAQDVGRDFGRCEAHFAKLDAGDFTGFDIVGEAKGEELQLVVHFVEAAAHEALDRVDDAFGRLDESAARTVADSDCGTATFGRDRVERDDRGDKVGAIDAGNNHRCVALHIGDERVGGAEIDSYYASFRHAGLICS